MNIKLENIDLLEKDEDYLPSDGLVQALNVSYALKRPLLLSGEPGTGKTKFANYVASQLVKEGFNREPLVFPTKSSSVSQDLFYFYDALSHFRKRSIEGVKQDASTENFIELRALGLAFLRACGRSGSNLPKAILDKSGVGEQPEKTVVLIDEIDKAPRDFPNDLLSEIEGYCFRIREIDQEIKLTGKQRENVIVIMTSNFEKSLPEAFLRRCVYYHIEFPRKESKDLEKIVSKRLNIPPDQLSNLEKRIADFYRIREELNVQKKPSTSECIDWVRVMMQAGLLGESLFNAGGTPLVDSRLKPFLPALLKKKEDLLLFNC